MKRHVRGDGKNLFAMHAQVHEAHAGDNLVRAALQTRQHLFRLGEVARLAKNFAAEKHQRVCAQHQRVPIFPGNGARLAMRVELAKLVRGKLVVENFRRITGDDREIREQLRQQFSAAGRGGGQDERRQFHAVNLSGRRKLSSGVNLRRASCADFDYLKRVQPDRHIVNLALIGFMGTGKTSVGKLVAEQLHFEFLDTDELIQSRTGRTIAEIFSKDGEQVFRELERQVVEQLAQRTRTVISTGGGLPANRNNLDQLKSHALTICLWASPEKIWERVRHQSHRPLLHDADPQKKIQDLLKVREPFYKQADVLVNTDLRSPREVAQQVALQFKLATRPAR